MKKLIILLFLSIFTFLSISPSLVSAHVLEYAAIKTDFKVENNIIAFKTEVPLLVNFESEQAGIEAFNGYFKEVFFVEQDGKPCEVATASYLVSGEGEPEKTVINGKHTCANTIKNLRDLKITSFPFEAEFKTYDHFVNVDIRGSTNEIIFSKDKRVYPDDTKENTGKTGVLAANEDFGMGQDGVSSENENLFTVIKRFIVIGIEHIVFGYDHLLFLLSIVLILASFRRVAILVTSFTIAHSITLISAASGLITVSPILVEPIIALSIAFMAARNIWILKFKKEAELKERWIVVFIFGLIHGLGFAGALSETGIPQNHFFPALISFNVGVELGQFMILAVVLPYLILLRPKKYRLKVLYGISFAIVAISLFWFFERILANI